MHTTHDTRHATHDTRHTAPRAVLTCSTDGLTWLLYYRVLARNKDVQMEIMRASHRAETALDGRDGVPARPHPAGPPGQAVGVGVAGQAVGGQVAGGRAVGEAVPALTGVLAVVPHDERPRCTMLPRPRSLRARLRDALGPPLYDVPNSVLLTVYRQVCSACYILQFVLSLPLVS